MNRKVLPNQLVTFFWSQYLTNILHTSHHISQHPIKVFCKTISTERLQSDSDWASVTLHNSSTECLLPVSISANVTSEC